MNKKNMIGEDIRLRKKYFACLVAALALLIALAVPALAEPNEVETITGSDEEVFTDSDQTAAPGFSIEPRVGEEETVETPMLIYATVPETTVGIVAIDDDIPPVAPRSEGLLSQRNLTFGALALGGLALLLSIVALARTRKKTAPNATGNYQKYF